jgi:hypothetical protein
MMKWVHLTELYGTGEVAVRSDRIDALLKNANGSVHVFAGESCFVVVETMEEILEQLKGNE